MTWEFYAGVLIGIAIGLLLSCVVILVGASRDMRNLEGIEP